MKHIAAILGTQNYARLRFGIGNDFPRGGQVDYVLGHFTDEDWKTMDERLEMAGEIIKSFCLTGIDITMNQFNKNNGLAPQKNKDDNEWLAINDNVN